MSTPRVPADAEPVIEIESIVTRFGSQVVHNGVSLTIRRGELVALIGGSGTGKSVLLREVIGLQRPNAGRVRLLGTDVWASDAPALTAMRRRFGMMFQDGALFSSLDVAANVATPLLEHADVPADLLGPLVDLRLSLAGLPAEVGAKMPSELSGGMRKRAAIARALALDPTLLYLDEPSSGLDPVNAARLDELILRLRDHVGTSVVMVTHDIDSAFAVADRMLYLDEREKTMTALDRPDTLLHHGPATVREFLSRGRSAAQPL